MSISTLTINGTVNALTNHFRLKHRNIGTRINYSNQFSPVTNASIYQLIFFLFVFVFCSALLDKAQKDVFLWLNKINEFQI